MADSLTFKVYDKSKRLQACCDEVEAAAALVAFYGNGATIRIGNGCNTVTVWTEGSTGRAADSYGAVADRIDQTLDALAFSVRVGRLSAGGAAHA